MKMLDNIIENVHNMAPLVHNITNYVTVNDCANVLLACGASPIMADDEEEVCEITSICNALNINIGTLNSRTISSMFLAGRKANELKHPVVLDPVGAGASALRTQTALNIMNEIKLDVIKGNISEIKTLYDGFGNTKGVDADESEHINNDNLKKYADMAKELSRRTGAIIVVTGAIDIVADDKNAYAVYNGHKSMSKISGTGCMLSAMIAAYITANMNNKLEAALCAVAVMGIAGERAVMNAIKMDAGSGSLKINIIDEIYKMTDESMNEHIRYECIDSNIIEKSLKTKLISNSMKVYAVTDRSWLGASTLYEQVEQALKGGATFIQLREKDIDEDEFLSEALSIRELADKYNVPFVINDNIDICLKCGADGVHLGQRDMEAGYVRKLLGDDKIIGVSAHTVAEAVAAERAGADYLGVGAVFTTSTKDDAEAVSYDTLCAICDAVNIPVVAIGGINCSNITELKDSGINGVAVISAIFAADDIMMATKNIKEAVGELLDN